jgi:hypothetical protein
VVSCRLADPFGHSRPRLTGESGSPSIWTTFSLFTNTFWPQPTAQYGQTDFTTLSAVAMRGSRCRDAGDWTAAPRPSLSAPLSCRTTGQFRKVRVTARFFSHSSTCGRAAGLAGCACHVTARHPIYIALRLSRGSCCETPGVARRKHAARYILGDGRAAL